MNRVIAAVLSTTLALAGAAQAERGTTGLTLTPKLGWAHGDHAIDVDTHLQYRWEHWKAESDEGTDISGIRGRIGAGYTWRDRFRVYVQAQIVSVLGMESEATGAAGLYRASAGKSNEWSINARQFYAEGRWNPVPFARVGRQDINQGTLVKYAEPHWNYLRVKRMSQRLLGTVGWTHVERSYDAVTARVKPLDRNTLHLFVARPTTGVFEIANSYEANTDIITGGFDWTVERGKLLENVELTGFFTAYHDTRDPVEGRRPVRRHQALHLRRLSARCAPVRARTLRLAPVGCVPDRHLCGQPGPHPAQRSRARPDRRLDRGRGRLPVARRLEQAVAARWRELRLGRR